MSQEASSKNVVNVNLNYMQKSFLIRLSGKKNGGSVNEQIMLISIWNYVQFDRRN